MTSLAGKRLVIFGCGYIGSEVARYASARGVQVTALTRNPARAEHLRASGIATVVADLASDHWHQQIAGEFDFVLNAVSSGGGGTAGYRHSYVEGMRSMFRWAGGHRRIGTLVYTSSTSVYPQGGGVEIDESVPTSGSGELPQILLEAENLLRETCFPRVGQAGLGDAERSGSINRCFILRLAGIYGPGRTHLVDQVRSGSVAGRGEHHLNLAFRDDIVTAIWSAFESSPTIGSDVFNVVDDSPAPKELIVQWLADQLGVPVPVFTGVAVAGRRAVTPDRRISNTKLKSVLGWRPRYPTFRDGYKNMLALAAD
jgi:nucleoside-diphosphate-sugar epimerase